MGKRLLDTVCSLVGLVLLAPLFLVVAVLIKVDSPGPVFFRQERVGRRFRPFRIWKFRTMVDGAAARGPAVTASGDPRVTRVGRLLRRTKVDELPQLINVLAGEMSLVGPRPEVPRYVDLFRQNYVRLLEVRPGITDPASLRFADEEGILAAAADRERAYVEQILPEKIRLSLEYVEQQSLRLDMAIIAGTLCGLKSRRL